jgi:hypothetical protein
MKKNRTPEVKVKLQGQGRTKGRFSVTNKFSEWASAIKLILGLGFKAKELDPGSRPEEAEKRVVR